MIEKREVPFGRPWITAEDREAVFDVLRGHILTHGPQCKAFEAEFASFLGEGAYCVSVSSCMAALHLAYFEMGLGAGDEVIVPAQTHTATAHAVELMGAKAVFCDCEPTTGNMTADRIEKLITPKTRAISVVHFLGIPCDMDRIMAVAEKHKLKVIEDCAIAVGARIGGKHVGLFGDAGCFSFYPVKHITTAEGGMFITRHKALAAKVALLRGFGVDRTHTERTIPGIYDVKYLGLNYRMSEMQAALGRGQIQKIPAILSQRKANFEALKKGLSINKNIRIIDTTNPAAPNSHYCMSVILLNDLAARREEIVKGLNDLGIGTSIYYPGPVPAMTYYREKYGFDEAQFPNAVEISRRSFALPVGPHLVKDDITHIVNAFQHVINNGTKA